MCPELYAKNHSYNVDLSNHKTFCFEVQTDAQDVKKRVESTCPNNFLC